MLTKEEIEIGRAYDILLVRLANYGRYIDGEILKKSKKEFLLSLNTDNDTGATDKEM